MALDPLSPTTRLVDADGRPTPFLLRQWENLRRALRGVEGVSGSYRSDDTHGLRLTINARGQVTKIEEVEL